MQPRCVAKINRAGRNKQAYFALFYSIHEASFLSQHSIKTKLCVTNGLHQINSIAEKLLLNR